MDLLALIPQGDTIEVTFEHKGETLTKKDGDPCTWTLWAPHSEKYKEITYERVVESINESRKQSKEGDKTEVELTVEEVKKLQGKRVEDILDVTKTFDLEMGEKPVKYSRKKAQEILERAPKILVSLEEALKEDGDFT